MFTLPIRGKLIEGISIIQDDQSKLSESINFTMTTRNWREAWYAFLSLICLKFWRCQQKLGKKMLKGMHLDYIFVEYYPLILFIAIL